MLQYRRLEVRDCQGTLWAFYREYQDNALASFEGDLAALHLNEIPGASDQQTSALKRQTIKPELDFCVVPINTASIAMLKARLSTRGVLGRDGLVIHTQIEVAKELILIACDNFHDDCTVASHAVPKFFLSQLKAQGLLRAYSDA